MIDISIMKMRTATVADLRNNFRHISSWIDNGETVTITRRGRFFAQLTPAVMDVKKSFKAPNFAAQRKKIWGNHRAFTNEEVREMREFELGEQEK